MWPPNAVKISRVCGPNCEFGEDIGQSSVKKFVLDFRYPGSFRNEAG